MNETSIKWTEMTWNPTSGCTAVSPGCAHCYARELAERRRGTVAFPVGFDVVEKPHKLKEAEKIAPGTLVFVNSMSDLFHERISDGFRGRIIDAIETRPDVTFQTLTKRPGNAAVYFARRTVPQNLWLGVSIESQDHTGRASLLRRIDAHVRFVSAEPLLSALVLDLTGISWLIVGGESGSHITHDCGRALVTKPNGRWVPKATQSDWVRSLRDQARGRDVAFFFKQWGGPRPDSGGDLLDGRRCQAYPRP